MAKRKETKIKMPKGSAAKEAKWGKTRGSYLTHIPEITDKMVDELEVAAIDEPFAYVRIVYDNNNSEYVYEIWEPQLTEKDKKILELIKDSLTRTLEYDSEKIKGTDKEEYLKESIDSFIKTRGLRMDAATKDKIVYYIIRDYIRYGPIDVLMRDPRVEDVSCDGVEVPLFIFHQKYESIRSNLVFEDEDLLNSFVILLGQRCKK